MRYIVGFILFILLIVVGLILIFSGGGSPKKSPAGTTILPLTQYANSEAAVSMTIDGSINGDDAHRAIRITVSRDQRLLEVIQGYSGHVIDSHPFYNTQDAYTVFLRAINKGGFLVKNSNKKVSNDYRGQCADGNTFIFVLKQNDQPLSNLWTSDCDSSAGTFTGNSSLVQDLFKAQITGYDDLTSQVEL